MSGSPIQTVLSPRRLPSKVVVLGSSGMVGRAWMGLLTSHGIPVAGFARPDIDLLRPESLLAKVHQGTDLVVNAAAWTDVDGAEKAESDATTANAHAVSALAGHCAAIGSTLITYSTDYVFDGGGTTPYPVDGPIAPINAYGRSKAAGERLLAENATGTMLIRTSWVYAPWGKNFVRTIAGLARTKPELRVVNDQRGRPTSAEGLAGTSLALYLAGAAGTWHATDGGECTWHGLASRIVQRLGLPCKVLPCTTAEFPRPAARPAYSTLDLSNTEALVGPRAGWESALDRVLERLERA